MENLHGLAQRPGADFANRVAQESARRRVVAQSRGVAARAGDIADQVVEPMAVSKADASRLVQRRHHALVLKRRPRLRVSGWPALDAAPLRPRFALQTNP